MDIDTKKRFDKLDNQFSNINNQIDNLAKAMLKGFDRIDKTLETKASNADMQRVLSLLDAMAKRQEITEDEMLVMGHQLERLDKWTHELAKKIGYTFSV